MNKQADRVLVVDDDPELRALLRRFLTEHGFETRAVESGSSMRRELARNPADIIILDLMMPEEDGLSICRRLRVDGEQIPIIMLTAKGDPIDKIIGLESGADDYLAKPFEPRELVARLNAVRRRTRNTSPLQNDQTVNIGPLEVNFSTMVAKRDGTPLLLSSREFSLLSVLLQSRGRPLTRAQIIDRVHGHDFAVTDRAIDVQVARLRKAIGDDGEAPKLIKTIWGTGYMMVGDNA
ncbi:MAG: response regulator [Pseudomonadota bacterium]